MFNLLEISFIYSHFKYKYTIFSITRARKKIHEIFATSLCAHGKIFSKTEKKKIKHWQVDFHQINYRLNQKGFESSGVKQ